MKIFLLAGLLSASFALGAEPKQTWKPKDMNRPRPKVVDPGAPKPGEMRPPPPNAIVLFDGKDLSKWVRRPGPKDADKSPEPKWKVENGYMEIVPKGGTIASKEKFGDCEIHIEWATPVEVSGKGQGRGNSGVFLPGHQEVQVLDSYENDTYPDGQAGAIYAMYPPLVNACRKPGEWQSYHITLRQPRFDAQGKMTVSASVTVVHNGILIQDNVELRGEATEGPLILQDHKNPVRYRNIWIRTLPAR
ncbi:MAG: DUF1080 domain-containing protein [Verrucomicrobia bacterium]|nr:DUF1080 domain-containing protein [Verrucomicrobiota bacterium]